MLHNAGPAQDLDGIHSRHVRQLGRKVRDTVPDQLDELRVDLQVAACVGRATKIQRTFNFAAAERRTGLLAKRLFFRPQVLRQLELHVEVTMIDRAYLPRQRADGRFCGLSREACHTV